MSLFSHNRNLRVLGQGFPPWRLTHGRLLFALVGLSAFILAPGPVRASCGHYVLLGSQRVEGTSSAPDAAPRVPARPRFPCTGPRCSRGTDPVPLVPAPAPPGAPLKWLPPPPSPDLPEPDGAEWIEAHHPGQVIRLSFPPDPPPRPFLP